MIRISKDLCRSLATSDELRYDLHPLQLGLGNHPWRVACASTLLVRGRRVVADLVLPLLFSEYPTVELLAHAWQPKLAAVVSPCGLQNRRAKTLIDLSQAWLGDWDDLRDLPGVGPYVNDAVGLVCFGCTELDSTDGVLRAYAELTTGCGGTHPTRR